MNQKKQKVVQINHKSIIQKSKQSRQLKSNRIESKQSKTTNRVNRPKVDNRMNKSRIVSKVNTKQKNSQNHVKLQKQKMSRNRRDDKEKTIQDGSNLQNPSD